MAHAGELRVFISMPIGWPTELPSGESKDPPPRNGSRPSSSPAATNSSGHDKADKGHNQAANGRHVRHENGGGGSGDIELAREPLEGRHRSVGDGDDDTWDSKEGFGGRVTTGSGMGAKNAKTAAVGGGEDGGGRYEVIEREEPLLEAEDQLINGER